MYGRGWGGFPEEIPEKRTGRIRSPVSTCHTELNDGIECGEGKSAIGPYGQNPGCSRRGEFSTIFYPFSVWVCLYPKRMNEWMNEWMAFSLEIGHMISYTKLTKLIPSLVSLAEFVPEEFNGIKLHSFVSVEIYLILFWWTSNYMTSGGKARTYLATISYKLNCSIEIILPLFFVPKFYFIC